MTRSSTLCLWLAGEPCQGNAFLLLAGCELNVALLHECCIHLNLHLPVDIFSLKQMSVYVSFQFIYNFIDSFFVLVTGFIFFHIVFVLLSLFAFGLLNKQLLHRMSHQRISHIRLQPASRRCQTSGAIHPRSYQ